MAATASLASGAKRTCRAEGPMARTAAAPGASTPSPPETSKPLSQNASRAVTARDGERGHGAQCSGKGADDVVLRVPAGTVIMNSGTGETVADLAVHEQIALLARGGRGGLGNVNFKSSTNRTPRKATPGEPGEH